MIKNIQLSEEKARELYATGSPEFKKLLEENFDKTILAPPITDRVKTWKDVEKELGTSVGVPFMHPIIKEHRIVNAVVRIRALAEVLNEGWVPNFNDSVELKYYPYFKKGKYAWIFEGVAYNTNLAGAYSGTHFRTRELAIHVGTLFISLYQDYLPE